MSGGADLAILVLTGDDGMERFEIDKDVAEAAERLAAERNETPGKVISDLARESLSRQTASSPAERRELPPLPPGVEMRNGWPVILRRGPGVVTTEMVERLLLEADFEDAGLPPPPL